MIGDKEEPLINSNEVREIYTDEEGYVFGGEIGADKKGLTET